MHQSISRQSFIRPLVRTSFIILINLYPNILSKLLLDMRNGLTRIQMLGTNLGTIHDGVTPIQLEGIIELLQSLLRMGISRIFDPTVCLHQDSRSQIRI
mmetsp:Transcript_21459/g.31583  ORF Transcript_21459/g.31583 Transcript_21459/m.31583 type:complete len:99 (+) Transcript_21459:189-485(+)